MDVFPFDRLAKAVDHLRGSGLVEEDIFVQLGSCRYEPRHARFERFLSFGDVCENIRQASVVITHAGAGSTLVCIQQGKYPVIVPRLARFGEIVDDHQIPFARRLSESNVALAVEDMTGLGEAIASVRGRSGTPEATGQAAELCGYLEDFWRSLRARPAR